MQTKSTTIKLLVLTIISSVTLTVACSTDTSKQNSDSNPNATPANYQQETKQHGDMGGMSHEMSMDMDLGPADADYDLRFMDGMVVHHQGAVKMAEEALSKAQHPEIKKLAQAIITAQDQEITQMNEWRKTWYPKADETLMAYHAKMGHMMAMTEEQKQEMMMNMDLGSADPEFDLRFINGMIPHHEGALVMAQDALNKSQHPEIKKLAQAILTSQQQEIEQMKQWRKDWYQQ